MSDAGDYGKLASLYRTSEAAKLLGVSTATLRSWRMRNQGPAWIDLGSEPGTMVRYSLIALTEFINARTQKPRGKIKRCRLPKRITP
jgi:uncharacterized protein YjcR